MTHKKRKALLLTLHLQLVSIISAPNFRIPTILWYFLRSYMHILYSLVLKSSNYSKASLFRDADKSQLINV